MSKLIINIKQLTQVRGKDISFVKAERMNELPSISDAFLYVKNGVIADFGKMSEIPNFGDIETINAKDKIVLPAWCDSHSHSVFTGNRSDEYMQRIKGATYEDIAKNGGGILKSSSQINSISFEDLFQESKKRIKSLIRLGTGALEIKSGYGLSYDAELKMLEVINRLKNSLPIEIKSTFLGAHAVPKNYKKEEYFNLVIDKMLPEFVDKKLVDFVDIFCEENYFSPDDTKLLCKRANELDIRVKIHTNQFNSIGGIRAGVDNGALSVDHLEVMTRDDLNALKNSKTMPVLLPGCSFFLGIDYANARDLLSNGISFAIASDYNPGSCPTGNMNFILSLACNKLKLTTQQAINAATINGAYAMGVSDKTGSITKGKIANLLITDKLDSIDDLPYYIGDNLIEKVLIKGEEFN